MKRLEVILNKGLDEETEKYTMKEFLYLLQLSFIFCYARGKWIYLTFIHFIVVSFHLLVPLIQLLYTAHKIKEYHIGIAAQALHVAGGLFVSLIILFWLITKRRELITIFTIIHKEFYDYGESFDRKEAQVWYQDMKNFKNKLFKYVPIHILLIGLHAMFGVQLVDMWQGTQIKEIYINEVYMRLPVEVWFPFTITNEYERLLCMLYEITVCFFVLCTICSGILIILFLNNNINTQIRILILSIEKIEERSLYLCKKKYPEFMYKTKYELYKNKYFIHEYKYCLKQNYEHHQVILKAFRQFSNIQSPPMFAVVLALSLIIACGLMIIVKGDKRLAPQILSLLLLIMEIAGIGSICWRGQQLTDLGEELFQSFYTKTKWFHCPESIKLSIRIIQENTKATLCCKAGGLTPINLELFSSIMGSSYSYFNFIYAMDGSEEKK